MLRFGFHAVAVSFRSLPICVPARILAHIVVSARTSNTTRHRGYLCAGIIRVRSYLELSRRHNTRITYWRDYSRTAPVRILARGSFFLCITTCAICQRSLRLSVCTYFRGLRYLHGLRECACTRPCLRAMCAGVLVNVGGNQPPHVRKIRTFSRLGLASLRESCAGMPPPLRVWVRSRPLRLVLLFSHRIEAHTKPTNLCAAARLL